MKKYLVILMTACLMLPVTGDATFVDFHEYPVGTEISDQYSGMGVIFLPGTGDFVPTVMRDTVWPGQPFVLTTALTGGFGDFTIRFPNYAKNVSFDSGLWDSAKGVVTVTDISNVTHTYNNVFSYLTGPEVYAFAFPDLDGVLIREIYFNSSDDDGGASITNLSFTPVPIPGTMLLLGSGLAGMAAYRRKRRKK